MSLVDELGRWSSTTAYEMARRAEAEYLQDPSAVLHEVCPDTLRFEPWRGSHVEFSVTTCPAYQVVTFRGTQPSSLVDWLTDSRVVRRGWRSPSGITVLPGSVHSGFADAYESVESTLLAWLTMDRPIFITGHSLGGALATICAARIGVASPRMPMLALYTYGSPRVLDWLAATWLNGCLPGRSWRVVNNNDVVTRLPLSRPGNGYYHVGELTYLDADGGLVHDPSRWELFRSSVLGRVEALLGGEPTIDEVPGLAPSALATLIGAGIRTLREAAMAGSERMAKLPDVQTSDVAAVEAWAAQRLAGVAPVAAAFDGAADHSIALYVAHLRAAVAVEALVR